MTTSKRPSALPMKISPFVFAAAALLAASASQSQEDKNVAQNSGGIAGMCARTKCQHDLHVTLKDKNGATFDRTFETFPATVQPFGFVVVAGQTVYIEADIVDGKLANLTAVDKVSDPGKTITATFEQLDNRGMMLTVKNPYHQPLKFSMGIMPLEQGTLYKTSSCAIGPGIFAFETWPYPIFQVVLGRGQLLADDSKLICTE